MGNPDQTIAERIREGIRDFTASERRAGLTLLSHYPMAGLETVAEFAARAGVSAPSVLRFVARLGHASYPDFQRALRDELEAQLKTPLMKASHEASAPPQDRMGRFAAAMVANVSETFAHLPPQEFDAVAALLADPRRKLHLVGGRFTDAIARYAASHLRILRPGVAHLAGQVEHWRDHLLDLGRRDVLVVFDIRRYQENIVTLAAEAAGRGAAIVLVTDQWLSPVSRVAGHVLSARIEAPSNWDSTVAMLALTEALIAAVTERLWPSAKGRIEEIERLRGLS